MAGIFKAYDIRGIYGEDLTDGIFYRIARAYAAFAKVRRVVVARDSRVHSGPLFDAFSRGLADMGVDVQDIGLASTPMSYFANKYLKADGSVMITASHNTKEWNGCKLTLADAVPISGATGIMDIERMVRAGEPAQDAPVKGKIEKVDISEAYAAHVKSVFRLDAPVHIACDFANGMGIAEAVAFKGSMLTFDGLYGEYDGNFPNHEANPLKTETLGDLQKLVRDNPGKYAFGAAFDGDADRAGFVDENGEIVPMDFVTAIIARHMLSIEKGAVCFYDLRSSKVAPEAISGAGGIPMMSRVGHSFIKDQMRNANAVFAGELSGHYYFRANSTAESSSMAVYAIASAIASSGKTLSALVAPLRKYFQSGEINSRVSANPLDVLAKIKETYGGRGEVFELDGVSVDAWEKEGWWFNVRCSNTEPLVRLNLEAKTKELMDGMSAEVLSAIRG